MRTGTHRVRQRLRRLHRMDAAEIACRARQGASRLIDRAVAGSGAVPALGRVLATGAPPSVRELRAARDGFAAHAADRFFPGARDAAIGPLLRQRFPDAVAGTCDGAEAICAGWIDLLGYERLRLDRPAEWHRDVVSGVDAPLVHWTRLDPLDSGAVGDSKVTWELSRHQWLVTLAQAHVLTGDPRFRSEIRGRLQDWVRANPYGAGINWTSSLEAAYRLISWCWVLALLPPLQRDEDGAPSRLLDELLPLIWMHAHHVERYLSEYFSPNTHLTGEALGLFYAGVLFPEFADAARWRDRGFRILVRQGEQQIAGDGVYFEQSLHYQRYTIEIYLQFLILARRNGISVPQALADRVERLVECLLHLEQGGGRLPAIGDTDGGTVLPLQRRAPDDARGVCAVAAVHFGRGDFAWMARGAAPEIAWLFGRPGLEAWDALPAAPPAGPASTVFREGGYVVLRDGWHDGSHRMILDVGPLGCPVSGAHGHADLLSVVCSASGEDYLVDPGTFCYTASPEWRDHFRGTAAHNTLTIDGEDQARPAGPFAWETRPAATLHVWRSTVEYDFADASHAAYARPGRPLHHRRRVLFVKPLGWIVVDDVVGGTPHRLTLRFQFSPRRVTLHDGMALADGRDGRGLWLLPVAAQPMRAELQTGSVDPPAGWISRHYGERQPAPAIAYELAPRPPVRLATVLLPVTRSDASRPPEARPLRGEDGGLAGVHVPALDATLRFHGDGMTVFRSTGATWEFS